MRSVAIAFFAFLSACAPSQGPAPSTPQTQTVRVEGMTDSRMRIISSTVSRVDTVWTPLTKAWSAMPAVYSTLEIPIERFDAENNVIGNSGLKLYRRLGKIPLTRYLDCGQTQIGPNADSYEVVLTVLTKLERSRSDSSNTVIATTVEAQARPIQFRGDYIRCTSKGALERRVAEVVNIHLTP